MTNQATDHSAGATAYRDINPAGPMAHDLPHTYLPLTGYDRRREAGAFVDDDGTCCQFTAGGQRCQGTRREHATRWPQLAELAADLDTPAVKHDPECNDRGCDDPTPRHAAIAKELAQRHAQAHASGADVRPLLAGCPDCNSPEAIRARAAARPTITEPTAPPRTAARCWPFPCRDYHGTYSHTSGEDPCACPCHEPPTPAELRAR